MRSPLPSHVVFCVLTSGIFRAARANETNASRFASAATLPTPLNGSHTNLSSGGHSKKEKGTCKHGYVDRTGQCKCYGQRELRKDSNGIDHCAIADCDQGNYSFERGRCVCHPHWRIAGITNPFGFVEGKCTQYKCQTDAVCAELLGVVDATCPVSGWNCDCGFHHSMFRSAGAQCMYPWWAFASQATKFVLFVGKGLWFATLLAAVGLLPFGKNVVGTSDNYSVNILGHDLAWSIFIIKFGGWLYLFIFAVYVSMALLWVAAVVTIVVAALILLATVGCFMAMAGLGEGGGGAGVCEICSCNSCDCCLLSGGECGDATLTECCCICCRSGHASADLGPWALYSYDPCCWSYSPPGTTHCDCVCCCPCSQRCSSSCWQRLVWIPGIRLMVETLPRLPENMLGGVLGIAVGTHPLRNRYDPDSFVVRVLARPCWALTNRSDRWRRVVYEWLHEREAYEAVSLHGETVAEMRREGGSNRFTVGGVVVENELGTFTAADQIFNAEDYESNTCWICQTPAEQWDLWSSCRHAFCERCSGEMLKRRMACPLCRVRSGRIVRRNALAMELVDHADAVEHAGLMQRKSSPRRDNSVAGRGRGRPDLSMSQAPPQQQVPPNRYGV